MYPFPDPIGPPYGFHRPPIWLDAFDDDDADEFLFRPRWGPGPGHMPLVNAHVPRPPTFYFANIDDEDDDAEAVEPEPPQPEANAVAAEPPAAAAAAAPAEGEGEDAAAPAPEEPAPAPAPAAVEQPFIRGRNDRERVLNAARALVAYDCGDLSREDGVKLEEWLAQNRRLLPAIHAEADRREWDYRRRIMRQGGGRHYAFW